MLFNVGLALCIIGILILGAMILLILQHRTHENGSDTQFYQKMIVLNFSGFGIGVLGLMFILISKILNY